MSKDRLSEGASRQAELHELEFERMQMDFDMMTASSEEEIEYIKYKRTELDERIEHLLTKVKDQEHGGA